MDAIGPDDKPPLRPIRYAIMIGSNDVARWEAACLEKLVAVEGKPTLVIRDARESTNSKTRSFATHIPKIRKGLFLAYNRFLVARRSDAHRKCDISSIIQNVPEISCITELRGPFSQCFNSDDLKTVGNYDLDFIVRFAFGIIRGEILQVPRHGVWSYHHDDVQKYRGMPAGFWEVMNREPVTGFVLQKLTERLDGGVILDRGWIRTRSGFTRNSEAILMISSDACARAAVKLRQNDPIFSSEPTSSSAPIFKAPTNLKMIEYAMLRVSLSLLGLLRKLFVIEYWTIGFLKTPLNLDLVDKNNTKPSICIEKDSTLGVDWLPPLKSGSFIADPSIYRDENGSARVLAEVYSYSKGKGWITEFSFPEDTPPDLTSVVMPNIEHMSFPNVCEFDNMWLCTPEISTKNELVVYAKEQKKWKPIVSQLSGVAAVDPTLFFWNGFWWIFATERGEFASARLMAWYSASPLETFTPHVLNPIKIDERSARPAGAPFVYNGKLYRPAQNCENGYGGSININEVLSLSPNAFDEEVRLHIEPDPEGRWPHGIHTINHSVTKWTVDGKRLAWTPLALVWKLRAARSRRT